MHRGGVRRRAQRLGLTVAVYLAVALVVASSSFASPGQNGKVAFSSFREGNFETYAMNANGTGQVNLTNTPAAADQKPAWSPDGTKIAFWSDRDAGNEEIYVMNADGSNPVDLTNDPNTDFQPAWSPDGSKIAFSSF